MAHARRWSTGKVKFFRTTRGESFLAKNHRGAAPSRAEFTAYGQACLHMVAAGVGTYIGLFWFTKYLGIWFG